MLIRPAKTADAANIARVHIAAWQSAYAGLFPDDFLMSLSLESREAQWVWTLTGSTNKTAVAERDGKIVGFVSYGPAHDDDCDPELVAEIIAIYVDPDSWGNQIGTMLYEFAADDLSGQSFVVVTLWVLEANARARRFYERRGFELDGKTSTNSLGPPLQVVGYRRELLAESS